MPPKSREWSLFRHPEGACYFYHAEKRVFTDSNVRDVGILADITTVMESIEKYVKNQHLSLSERAQLVLDLDLESKNIYYYYVDHEAKAIFFLHQFDTSTLPAFQEAPQSTSNLHLSNEMEAQYWYFVQLYPTSTELSEEFVSKLSDTCIYWLADVSTSSTSTAPYTSQTMGEILELVGRMEKKVKTICPGSMAALARHMYMFAHTRFIHYHGESHVRLDRTASVHSKTLYRRTWLIKITSPLLFFGPDFHLRLLQEAWVDKIMHANVWLKITAKMQKEWIGLIAYSTLMLACGVSFLTIPGVVPDGGDGPDHTVPQIVRLFSYLSTISSFTSIILGCLLHRHHQTSVSDASAPYAQQYLHDQENTRFGLELLAIQHSLPHAFLMWSIVFFLAAFSAFCCTSKETASIVAVAVWGSVCCAFVAGTIYRVWDKGPRIPSDNSQASPDHPKLPFSMPGGSLRGSMLSLAASTQSWLSPSPTISVQSPDDNGRDIEMNALNNNAAQRPAQRLAVPSRALSRRSTETSLRGA